MRRSKAVSAWSLVAGAALLLSACSGGSGSSGSDSNGSSADIKSMATGKAQNGDNFKLADAPESDQVIVGIDEGYSAYNNDTPDSNSSYNTYVLTSVLSGVDQLDGNNKVLLNNDVFASWTVKSKSPQVVEWKIQPNVKWSDGAPFDCKDMYLSWLAHSGAAKDFTAASTTGYSLIKQGQCKDNLTFEGQFDSPYLDYKGMFNSTAIMPAHVLEQKTGISDVTTLKPNGDAAQLKKAGDFWTNKWKGFQADIMPSSGPYKITSFDQNSQVVTLEKNPMWAGAKGGPKKIIVKPVPDTKAMATALQNGEIDVAASTQPDATAANTLKGLAAQGVTYGSASQLTFEHLDLNYKKLFADKAARQAFFQVVNRQEVVDKLLKEVQADAQPLNSIVFFPGEQGYQDRYSKIMGGPDAAANAANAAKTLEAGGWKKGGDGIYAKDGKRFSVKITHNENARRSQTVEIIIAQAKAAGIEIKDETDPNFLKGRLDKGDYDIALFGWSAAPFKAEQKAIYQTKKDDSSQNYQGLSDPKIDTSFDTAVSATDEAAQTKSYQDADQAIADQFATVPLFQTPSMWAFRGIDRVYMQSYNGALWNAGEWEKKK